MIRIIGLLINGALHFKKLSESSLRNWRIRPALIGDIDPGASLDAYVGHQRVKTTWLAYGLCLTLILHLILNFRANQLFPLSKSDRVESWKTLKDKWQFCVIHEFRR